MPNWHIEFEVTGKYLSDAQATVHQLRGVSSIGVRPIKERAQQAVNGQQRSGTARALVRQAIVGFNNKKFKLADLTTSLNGQLTKPQLASHIHGLLKTGEIRRAGYGQYKAKAVRT